MGYGELDQVQKGTSWLVRAPILPGLLFLVLVKAVVSDRGGTLSHTAVVGREYGLPTLLNTFTGTATIKTGQRIRADATEGALYILKK
jgi:pyruvate,water dikinase